MVYFGDGLYELDPELTLPPRPIVVASEENPIPLGYPNAFDFGPDGRLYGPLQAAGKFISIDVDSCDATSDPWSDCDIGVLASGFHQPVSAKFDAHGVLHVQDLWTGELSTLDLATGRLFVTNADDGSVAEVLPGGAVRTLIPGGLITPGGVAGLERPGGGVSVLVADMHRLWEFDADTGSPIGFTRGARLAAGSRCRPPRGPMARSWS